MRGKIMRACDACRVRKVRCSGDKPCAQCAHLSLACSFAPAPAKRKPGIRGRLVAQLRDRAGNSGSGSTSSPEAVGSFQSPTAAYPAAPLSVTSVAALLNADGDQRGRHGGSASTAVRESSYAEDFFLKLIPDFEQLVYPINPLLSPAEIRAAVGNMRANAEDTALVYAFAAITVSLTQRSSKAHSEIHAQVTSLVQHGLRAHRQADLDTETEPLSRQFEQPFSVKRVVTCIFIEICLSELKRFERSFVLLREAIAMIVLLNIDGCTAESTVLNPSEVSRRQRMYWEAYIHERFLCIVSGLPCTLPPLKTGLPLPDLNVAPHAHNGFNRLIRLFQIMDGPLLTHWVALKDTARFAPNLSGEWIESKQAELDRDEAEAAESFASEIANGQGAFLEFQHADLFITRLWLRTLLWQLALAHGLLRSSPPQDAHDGLSLHFPAQRLSAQLRSLVCRLTSISSIAIHGSGMLQKLFEITSTVADVLALPNAADPRNEGSRARVEDFLFLVHFLFSFQRLRKHERNYLREKLYALQQLHETVDFAPTIGSSP